MKYIYEIYIKKQIDEKKNYLKAFCMNMALIGAISIGILVLCFRGFLEQSISNPIKFSYSAYQAGDMIYNYKLLLFYFGISIIFVAIIGMIIVFIEKDLRSWCLFIVTNFFVTTLMFFSVQSMGHHHYYLVITNIILLAILGIVHFYNKYSKLVYYFLLCLIVGNTLYSFGGLKMPVNFSSFFANQIYSPKIRTDLDNIQLLAASINDYTENEKKAYIVSGSVILNDDIVRKVNMPDKLNSVPNLDVTAQIDLRDGFPKEFLNADIVVVADPIQYHLTPDSQRVIGIIAEEFLSEGIISDNYEFIKEFELDGDVKAKMYGKIKNFNQEEISYIKDKFNLYYGSYPELFEDRIRLD